MSVIMAICVGGAVESLRAQAPEREPERRRVPEATLERPQEAQARAGMHQVRRGDTLWDLARRYLSDPFRWRDIFEVNTAVVEDPHWIFPGENLRLPGAVTGVAVRAGPGGEPAAMEARPAGQEPGPGAPQGRRVVSRFGGESIFDRSPDSRATMGSLAVDEFAATALVSASDFQRAPTLADPNQTTHGVTARKIEANPLGLRLPAATRLNHHVVIALNGMAVAPDQTLRAFRWGRRVGSNQRVVQPLAMLRVLDVMGDSARAQVVELFGDYIVGDLVADAVAFGQGDLVRHESIQGSGLLARVLDSAIAETLLGPGSHIFLNAGSADGVRIGDEFATFMPDEQRPSEALLDDRQATVRVVRVGPSFSTARVIEVQDLGTTAGSPARLVRRAAGAD
jgi:hypothetical protein